MQGSTSSARLNPASLASDESCPLNVTLNPFINTSHKQALEGECQTPSLLLLQRHQGMSARRYGQTDGPKTGSREIYPKLFWSLRGSHIDLGQNAFPRCPYFGSRCVAEVTGSMGQQLLCVFTLSPENEGRKPAT